VLANYEFSKDACVSTLSVLEAASKENENVSAHSLGKVIKEIWKGSVSRQYSARSCAYSYRHLRRRALMSCAIITEFDDNVIKNIHALCALHDQGWFFNSQGGSNQKSLNLFKFVSPEDDKENITVDGRRLIFELNIVLSPSPKLTLSTYGHAIPIEDVVGSDGTQLSLRTIDSVMRLVEFTVPCLGHVISDRTNTSSLKVPVLNSKNISVWSGELGNNERLISSSCLLLSYRSSSSCQNCAYSLKLYQNRENKRKANVSEAPNKKCNLRFLDRIGLEEKITTQRKTMVNDMKRNARAKVDDMLEFVEEDHADLQQIIESTDSALIPPGMKLLWEQQMKQLSAKSSKGFRWNPRFAYFHNYLTLYVTTSISGRLVQHIVNLWYIFSIWCTFSYFSNTMHFPAEL
jgi:hypothetical protein